MNSDKYGTFYDVQALAIMLSGKSEKTKAADLAALAKQAKRHIELAADGNCDADDAAGSAL